MFASFLLLRLESMFFIEQIKKNYIYSRIPKKCHAIFETKMCSDLMAATFMDFIKFGLDRKDLSQWQQIKWYLCQKFDSNLKNLQNLLKRIGELWKKIQCYQSIETNIGDHFYARTKLKLANRALWVARESSEEDPMTFIFDETLNLCEPEKFGESFASCRPATEEKKNRIKKFILDQQLFTSIVFRGFMNHVVMN